MDNVIPGGTTLFAFVVIYDGSKLRSGLAMTTWGAAIGCCPAECGIKTGRQSLLCASIFIYYYIYI